MRSSCFPPVKCVAVIGFGLMGAQIAQVFSQAEYSIKAFDVDSKQLHSGIELIRTGKYGLESLASKGKISHEEVEQVFSRITITATIEEASKDADLVLEAVIEDLGTKREIFEKAVKTSRQETILATNTSTLSISRISEHFSPDVRARLVGMHFFNPPQLMKLVEIIRTKETSDATISKLQVVAQSLRKTPIVVFDFPGFVANRIGISVFAEASLLLEKEVSSIRDIDLAMRLGYGHPMGPFELGDLVGLDSRLRNMQALYDETRDERFKPPKILELLVREGYRGDPRVRKGSRGGYYEYFALKRPSED